MPTPGAPSVRSGASAASRRSTAAGLRRLGADRRRPRHPRPAGRDGALRRRLAGQRLGVGPGARTDRPHLRRRRRLRAAGRRPLAGPRPTADPAFRRSRGPGRARPRRRPRGRRRDLAAAPGALDLPRRPHRRDPRRRRCATRTRWSPPPTTSSPKLADVAAPGVEVEPDRRRRDVVGLQRSQPRRDAEVGADLLAGDAGDPRARLRLAGRRRACR